MKGSAVQTFRRITDKIHPQVGLTPQESQRLLNALTTSFRKQLVEPAIFPDAPSAHRAAPLARRPGNSFSALTHEPSTAMHMSSFLTNPLLAKPLYSHVDPTLASSAVAGKLQEQTWHPVKVFESYVARGLATLEIARLCMEAFRGSLSRLPTAQAHDEIRRMDVGARIMRWLWASGSDQTQLFARDQKAFMHLAYFLVAEQRHDAVWDLMRTLKESTTLAIFHADAKADVVFPHAILLRSIMTAQMAHGSGGNLVSALRTFLTYAESLVTLPQRSLPQHVLLAPAGTYLVRKLLGTSSPGTVPSAEFISLYDQFVQSCLSWEKSSQGRVSYRVSQLRLHHPQSPTATTALELIREANYDMTHHFWTSLAVNRRLEVLSFCFATVHQLQNQHLHDDAIWVMDFMRRHFESDLLSQRDIANALRVSRQAQKQDLGQEQDKPSFSIRVRVPELG